MKFRGHEEGLVWTMAASAIAQRVAPLDERTADIAAKGADLILAKYRERVMSFAERRAAEEVELADIAAKAEAEDVAKGRSVRR